MTNTKTGEDDQRRLEHVRKAVQFYRSPAGQAARAGMEASGHAHRFERSADRNPGWWDRFPPDDCDTSVGRQQNGSGKTKPFWGGESQNSAPHQAFA
ncbi:MAG TPA: hypothetical protein VGS20_13860 [Candidatus Acidoferrales bacterium]|nr:hypothetical protein [Candidatus Acidoferrales bacterium]